MTGGDAARPLQIVVVGGRTPGLITAISLAEFCQGEECQISIMDSSYRSNPAAGCSFFDRSSFVESGLEDTLKEVITLTKKTLDCLSPTTKAIILRGVDEAVWSPDSRNLPLQELEDRLLERVQMPDIRKVVRLWRLDRPLNPGPEWEQKLMADISKRFDIILGADGKGSAVRRNLIKAQLEISDQGEDSLLEVTFRFPYGLYEGGLPRSLDENLICNVCQQRYLMNACATTRSGTISMLVTSKEFELAKRVDGKMCKAPVGALLRGASDAPLRPDQKTDQLFKPLEAYLGSSKDVESKHMWMNIRDGFSLFGIPEQFCRSIVGRQYRRAKSARIACKLDGQGPQSSGEKSGPVAVLVGDAASSTRAWFPTGGLNAYIQEGVVLAMELRKVIQMHTRGQYISDTAFKGYADFVGERWEEEYETNAVTSSAKIGATFVELRKTGHMNSDFGKWLQKSTEYVVHILSGLCGASEEDLEPERVAVLNSLSRAGKLPCAIMATTGPWKQKWIEYAVVDRGKRTITRGPTRFHSRQKKKLVP